jgi:hypothetical protein
LTSEVYTVLTTYCPENILKVRLAAVGVSVDTFSFLAGTKQSTLSRALRGTAPLGADETKRYLALSQELQQLASTFEPFTLGAIDARVLEILLRDFRSNAGHWSQLNAAMSEIRRNVEETLSKAR